MTSLSASRRRSLAAILTLCVGLMAAPVLAQQPEPSAAHLALARSVVEATGLNRSFRVIPLDLAQRFRSSLVVTRPEITKDLDEVIAGLEPEFEKERQVMTNAAARIMANRIPEAELKDIDAFFKSPAGKRYVDSQPAMMDDLFRDIQAWSVGLGENMIARIRDELKKKGHNL